MRRPSFLPQAGLLAVLVAVGLLLLTAGPAVADHAYSHRYIVSGRVIDSSGEPAMSIQVTVTLQNMDSEGACPTTPSRSTTDGWGDYYFCYHVHSLAPGAQVTIQARDHSYTTPADASLRKTVHNIALPTPEGSKDPSVVAVFKTTYTLRGRVWQPVVGAVVEGISVQGVSLTNTGVHATLVAGGQTQEKHLISDGYGDFSAQFTTPNPVASGAASAAVGSVVKDVPVDTAFMVSDLVVVVPADNPTLSALQAGWPFIAGALAIAAVVFVVVRYAPRRPKKADVGRIPGVGRSKATELREAGFRTVDALAAASAHDVTERTALSQKEAKRLIKKARDMLSAGSADAGDD